MDKPNKQYLPDARHYDSMDSDLWEYLAQAEADSEADEVWADYRRAAPADRKSMYAR